MSKRIVLANQSKDKLASLHFWWAYAEQFITDRQGVAGARDDEFIIGYVDNFRGVYVKPWVQVEGETWYVWFIFPGKGKAARLVSELWPGVYADHEGNVIEHDPEWTLILGTVTRKGDQPLLSPDML